MFDEHTMETLEERARVEVRGGFEELDLIEEGMIELVEHDPDTEDALEADPDAATALVRSILRRHVEAHAREQEGFPEVTDTDRLDEVFAALDADGIVVGQNVGYTMSDLRDDMWEELGERPDARGWIGFHGQDLERVLDGGPLMLGFAHRSDQDADFVVVAGEVRDRLVAAGFEVEWDGDAGERLAVHGITWQRRRSADGVLDDEPDEDGPDGEGPAPGGGSGGLFARAARRLRGDD